MAIRVIVGKVDTGSKIYGPGEVITELSAADEVELVAKRVCEWDGSQLEGEAVSDVSPEALAIQKADEPQAAEDEADEEFDEELPRTTLPGLEEPAAERRRGRRRNDEL